MPGVHDKSNNEMDVVIVGSGMNSLACAALLAKRGKSVVVLERNPTAGGCIRSEELFPGYVHDVLSSWYPLFVGSPAYAELKDDLHAAGLEFAQCPYATGLVRPDGSGVALRQDMDDSVCRINSLAPGDGDAFRAMASRLFTEDADLTFGLLGNNPYGFGILKLLFKEWRKRGVAGMRTFTVDSLESFRRWSERTLQSDLTRALMAPWVLHGGLGPDESCSALIGKLTFAAVVTGGMPVVRGGSGRIVSAFQTVIEKFGGQVLTGVDVEKVLVRGNHVTGVATSHGVFEATCAIVCNVTPPQLYGRLLPAAPEAIRQQAAAYRFGRGGMQIHFALKAPPNWKDAEFLQVPLIHLTESMEQVCTSVVEANNGLLPARPTLAIGQPVAVDPSRAPRGGWILWIQMQEMPSRLKGDAAGEIPIPADGCWNETVREAMANRAQARLELVMPGLAQQVVGRRTCSPADLEGLNCNLVGGDPYSGACTSDQFFWLRPFAGAARVRGHRTPYRNLFHIGASTHPGPGLGAGSGFLVAQQVARS